MSQRGVWQLKLLTLVYCPHSGSSIGTRAFIRNGQLKRFAQNYPHLQIQLREKRGGHPHATADYLGNQSKTYPLRRAEPDLITKALTSMINTSGRKFSRIKKEVKTNKPSIQGMWQPALLRPEMKFTLKHIMEE